MEGVCTQQFNGQTLLIGNPALLGAIQRVRGKGFSAPSQLASDSYDDAPYGDEYGDAYGDYQDTMYDE